MLLPLDDTMDVASIVDRTLAQTFRPGEVVVGTVDPAGSERGIDAMTRAGMVVHVVETADDRPWRALAEASSRAWVVLGLPDSESDPNALLDLAMAAECSRADAIGYVADRRQQFVSDLALIGSLVRRDLLVQDVGAGMNGRLGAWARRGSRLMGIPGGAEAVTT